MVGAVEPLPGLSGLEPMVSAGIDHQGVRRAFGDLGGQGAAGSVGQGQEDHVVPGEDLGGGVLKDTVRQGVQVRLQCPQALAGVGVGGDGTDGHVRVGGEQAQHLTPGVSAGS